MILFLNVLLFCLKVIESFCVLALLVIGADMAWYTHGERRSIHRRVRTEEKAKTKVADMLKKAQDSLRTKKEAEAEASFFEQGYAKGFDNTGAVIYRGHSMPIGSADLYFKMMDELVDGQIFENTEDV